VPPSCPAYRFESISGIDATWQYLFIYLSYHLYGHMLKLDYRDTIEDTRKERRERIDGKIGKGNGGGVGKGIG
jgi:hypothetical protein